MLDGPIPIAQLSIQPPSRRADTVAVVAPVLEAVSIGLVETSLGRWRFRGALLVAALVHGVGVLAALALHQPPGDGGGGATLDAVSVDVVLVAPAASAAKAGPDAISATAGDGWVAGMASTNAMPGARSSRPNSASDTVTKPEPEERTLREPAAVIAAASDDEVALLPEMPHPMPKLDARRVTPKDIVAKLQPSSTPAAAAPARPMTVASNGSGAALTTGSLHRTPTPAQAASPGQVRRFTQDVARLLSRHRPKLAGRTIRGTVRVAFAISGDGGVIFVRVTKTSGSASVDQIALAAVQGVHFPRPPEGMTSRQLTYEIPYHFR